VKSSYYPWLHRYSILVAFCTLLLVVAGASVTSKEAGLSVPDWPLAYGQVLPPMGGLAMFEQGHRLIATSVGLLTIILAVWLSRVDPRSWMRKLGWYALGAVIVQGLLGRATVLWLQPPWVSAAHACLAQLFFSMTVSIAVFTSRSWQQGADMVQDYGTPSLRSLAILTPIIVLVQIGLGAAFRHRALSLMPHMIGAMVATIAVLIVSVFVLNQFPNHAALRQAARTLLGVVCLQVFLGIAAYFARLEAHEYPLAMVLTTVAHVATGGLTLASTIILSIHIRRNVRASLPQSVTHGQAVTS
jgi:heme a synthase